MTATDRFERGRNNSLTPPELEAAMQKALKEFGTDGATTNPHDLLTAAERLLEKVLASECAKRESALDLLTVDALVTRALAIASEDAEMLSVFPEAAMRRIAGLRMASVDDN